MLSFDVRAPQVSGIIRCGSVMGGGAVSSLRNRPARKGEDQCEYFDVSAEVVISVAGSGSRTYQATGACGC